MFVRLALSCELNDLGIPDHRYQTELPNQTDPYQSINRSKQRVRSSPKNTRTTSDSSTITISIIIYKERSTPRRTMSQ